MKPTRTERWILSNQYRILAALYPKERDSLEAARTALEEGYELHYRWAAEHVYPDGQTMSEEESKEVLDILEMHEALALSLKQLGAVEGVSADTLLPVGFDGNDTQEGKYMAYARYFCSLNGGRFSAVVRADDFNMHCPTLHLHRARLRAWRESANKHVLTTADVIRIASARP